MTMRMMILMYPLLASEEGYDFYNTTDNIIIKMYGNNLKLTKMIMSSPMMMTTMITTSP